MLIPSYVTQPLYVKMGPYGLKYSFYYYSFGIFFSCDILLPLRLDSQPEKNLYFTLFWCYLALLCRHFIDTHWDLSLLILDSLSFMIAVPDLAEFNEYTSCLLYVFPCGRHILFFHPCMSVRASVRPFVCNAFLGRAISPRNFREKKIEKNSKNNISTEVVQQKN